MPKKLEMTSRERILTVIAGKRPDRLPLMYWLNPHGACRLMAEYRSPASLPTTLLAQAVWHRFRKNRLGQDREFSRLLPYGFLEYGNGEYLLHLGSDVAFKSMGNFKGFGSARKKIFKEEGHLRFLDPFGAVRALGGIYFDVLRPPVRSIDQLATYCFPKLDDASMIRRFRKRNPQACILIEVGGPQQITSQNIWNLEQYMLALYDAPDTIAAFQRRVAEWSLNIARNAVRAGADIVFIGDDYGMNHAPLIDMDMWKRYTYPFLKFMIEEIHRWGVPVMLHSCGYQMPFLEWYARAGLDILQSFQPMAGNDLETAVREFGDKLVFATGIDTQQGEMMSPEEFRDSIVRSHDVGTSRGRFILAMTHMLQYTMPKAHVEAMFETVRYLREGSA